jgi:hypothetical protein
MACALILGTVRTPTFCVIVGILESVTRPCLHVEIIAKDLLANETRKIIWVFSTHIIQFSGNNQCGEFFIIFLLCVKVGVRVWVRGKARVRVKEEESER